MKKWISLLLCTCMLLTCPAVLAEEDAPSEAVTEEAKPTEAPEPTEAPTAEPTEEPTEAPTQEPTEAPTEAPVETPAATDAAQSDPTTTPGQTADPTADAEAWTKLEEGVFYGTLAEVVAKAAPDAKIYIKTEKVVKLTEVKLKSLAKMTFLPDPDAFTTKKVKVFVYAEHPEKVDEPDEIDLTKCADSEGEMDLYFRVESIDEEEEEPTSAPTETPEPTEAPRPEISVTTENFDPARWGNEVPVFHLSGIEDFDAYSYAVVRFDSRIDKLDDGVYESSDEGVYTLRFVIRDEMDDIISASQVYTVLLDMTPPVVTTSVDDETGLTLMLEAVDDQSGLRAMTLDGGTSWISLGDEATTLYTKTYSSATTIPAGQITVMDAAGNAITVEQDIVLKPVSTSGGGGGGGGSGSDDSSTKKPVSHGSGSGKDEGVYDQVDVEASQSAAHQLVLGGETLALTLDLTEADGFDIPDGYQAKFLTSLMSWPIEGMAVRTEDTMVLSAAKEPDMGDSYEYRWQFNGEVIKLLNNSGIRYLVLKVDDQVITLPTEGFTGGTKYTELKMSGVSSRKFDYAADMACEDGVWRVRLSVTVEGEEYSLGQNEGSEMYAYDVQVGTADLLKRPYGSTETEAD